MKFIQKLVTNNDKVEQALYQTPAGTYRVVSASTVMLSGPETYIFQADEAGEVTDWGELPGSELRCQAGMSGP